MVPKEEWWPLCRVEEHQLFPRDADAAPKLGYLPKDSFLGSNRTGVCISVWVAMKVRMQLTTLRT